MNGERLMRLSLIGILFIPLDLLAIWTIYIVTERLNLKKYTLFLMIISIVIIGAVYHYILWIKDNQPKLNERYKLKTANFQVDFKKDGNADIKHIITIEKNKVNDNNMNLPISYAFKENGSISNHSVKIDDELLVYSDYNKAPNNYNLSFKGDKYIFNINPKSSISKILNIEISYKVKNAIKNYGYGFTTYTNNFLSERSGFSYNNKVKGKISFNFPKEVKLYKIAGYSKDLYTKVEKVSSNNADISFELQIPYGKNIWRRFPIFLPIYDPYSYLKKDYMKDFAINTRVDLYSSEIKIGKSKDLTNYSMEELNELSTKNNEKFSNIKTVYSYIVFAIRHEIGVGLILCFPFLYESYRSMKQEKEDRFWNIIYDFLDKKNK